MTPLQPPTSLTGSWLWLAAHTKNVPPSVQIAFILRAQTLVTTHVLSAPHFSGHRLDPASGGTQLNALVFWKSPHMCATVNSSSVCQGHTGRCAPHHHCTRNMQASRSPCPLGGRVRSAGSFQNSGPCVYCSDWGNGLYLSKYQFPPMHNEDKDACPLHLRGLRMQNTIQTCRYYQNK